VTLDQAALLDKARRSVRNAKMALDAGDYDFAASRAYYAMFYLAEAVLLCKGLLFSSHGGVQSAFGQHFGKTALIDPKFHRYLIDAYKTRTRSDYEARSEITEAQAAEEIAHAEEFLAAAEPLLRGADKETPP